ncbi:MAG TPA: hypothetical protein VD833_21245 [Vicinamibacterales bacterium]|nr:hypothetical protein [Vicinamibacterales bacterium]
MTLLRACGAASAAALLLLSAACAGAPRQRPVEGGPVETGAGSLTAARKYLEGRWTLESFEMYPPGKAPITLKGSGSLVYDEFGNMRMEIRADEASSDLLRASGIDIRDGVISTDGRTAVDMQNRTLTYVIKDQSPLIPGPLATSRPRYWEVTADILTLTTKDDAGKPLSVGRWRRSK